MADPPSGETRWGFWYGAAKVERLASLPEGRVCIGITPEIGKRLDVYVSATGRSVRVFRDGKELR